MEKLKDPIVAAKWKRITFLYTTGEYLLNATTLKDLVVDDEWQVLWMSLRERAENEQLSKADLPEADVSLDVLLALLGIEELDRGWRQVKRSPGVRNTPYKTILVW